MSSLTRFRGRVMAVGGVIALLLVAGVWIALNHASAQPAAGTKPRPTSSPSATVPAGPLQLVSSSPAAGTKGANGAGDIKIQFSAPVAAGSPMPTLKPAIHGTWQGVGTDTLEFVPATGFGQLTHVQVRIPGGPLGIRTAHGSLLPQSTRLKFETGTYSSTRLAQLLAQLGYLPLTWTPAAGATAPAATDTQAQLSAAFDPPQGAYTWQAGWPSELKTFWQGGAESGLVMKGAVMAFESEQSMAIDGIAGPAVWSALLKAVAANQMNKNGYSYALAKEGNPETLTVWHNGKIIMHSLANTGIGVDPTTLGTAPVYLKYYFQVMKGKNPDGSKYADPVYYVSYFRAGEAVHYFNRGSYGWPQSLGCVELPWSNAKFIWKYLPYGSLVTVAPGSQTPASSPHAA